MAIPTTRVKHREYIVNIWGMLIYREYSGNMMELGNVWNIDEYGGNGTISKFLVNMMLNSTVI